MSFFHIPVMCREVLEAFDNDPAVYLDLTAGGGGHALEIIKKYPNLRAVLIDRDEEAIACLKEKFRDFPNVTVVKSAFSKLDKILFLLQIPKVDIIFADLGTSSFQFDAPSRGFSVSKEGPLDMRMDRDSEITALDLIKKSTEGELRNILTLYAQERESGKVARVLKRCAEAGMTTTLQFANEIRGVKKYSKRGLNPSTQTFMALRMAVNDEIGELEKALKRGFALLSEKGIMGIISFHSTEDKIVKNFFRDRLNNVPYYVDEKESTPLSCSAIKSVEFLEPAPEESLKNPRARSAKLRIIKKFH